MINPGHRGWSLIGFLLLLIVFWDDPGCKTHDDAVSNPSPSPCTGADTTLYGSGDFFFIAPGAGDTFAVSGRYVPSSEYGIDSASQGAGAFLSDTLILGHRVSAQLAAYTHALTTGGGSNERSMVILISDSVAGLSTGDYQFIPFAAPMTGRSAAGHFLYYSDEHGVYSTYDISSGTLTITSLDTCARRIAGTFSGILQAAPPDTGIRLNLLGGTFHLHYVTRAYIF